MKKTARILGISLGMVMILSLVAAVALAAPSSAQTSPGTRASLPADTCTFDGSTRTCELWASEGTITMPDGATVPIWGFSDSLAGIAQSPGPAIIVNEGERVEVTLHNDLPIGLTGVITNDLSLSFPGQDLVPDMIGTAPGGTVTYVFTPTVPGTYSYEAGLTPLGARQVAMGLFGGLVVRPAGGHPGPTTPTASLMMKHCWSLARSIPPLTRIRSISACRISRAATG